MKIIAATCFLILAFSCQKPNSGAKSQQEIFETSILNLRDRLDRSPNEIASENILKSALDSIDFEKINMDNWSGNIKNIYQSTITTDSIDFKLIEFIIVSEHQRCEINYVVNYIIRSDSLKNDSIYNSILKFGNLEKVIFSGKMDKNPVSVILYNSHYPEFNIILSKIWNQKQ